jgi:hypothetical protein
MDDLLHAAGAAPHVRGNGTSRGGAVVGQPRRLCTTAAGSRSLRVPDGGPPARRERTATCRVGFVPAVRPMRPRPAVRGSLPLLLIHPK